MPVVQLIPRRRPRALEVPELWSWLRSLPAAVRVRALFAAAELYLLEVTR